MSNHKLDSFEGLEGLQALAAIDTRLRQIERPPKADGINNYAAELTERDADIRSRFGSIFGVTGYSFNKFTNGWHTPKITLARIASQGAKLAVELSVPDRQKYRDEAGQLNCKLVTMEFYSGGRNPFHEEVYESNRVVDQEDYAAKSAAWSRTAGSHYDGYRSDFISLENMMHTAEDRLTTIETALADLSLNRQFAEVLMADQQG